MKEEKNKQQTKHTAEEWVQIAKNFGEKCLEIQKDSTLNTEQKLKKQSVLSAEISRQIQNDPYLKDEDKNQMIESINSYMNEWKSIQDSIQKILKGEGSNKNK